MRLGFQERFWAKVETSEGCWNWVGARGGNGYGQFSCGSRTVPAHRASLWIAGRETPDNLDVDHLCRNRRCVRPDHLEVVTRSVNVARARAATAPSHCKRGHALNTGNIYRRTDGCKECLTCRRSRDNARNAGTSERRRRARMLRRAAIALATQPKGEG